MLVEGADDNNVLFSSAPVYVPWLAFVLWRHWIVMDPFRYTLLCHEHEDQVKYSQTGENAQIPFHCFCKLREIH